MVSDGEEIHVFFPGAFGVDFLGAAPAAGQGSVIVELTGIVIPKKVGFRHFGKGQNFLRVEYVIHDHAGEFGPSRGPIVRLQGEGVRFPRQLSVLSDLTLNGYPQSLRSRAQAAFHQRQLPGTRWLQVGYQEGLTGGTGDLQNVPRFGGNALRQGQHRAAGAVLENDPDLPGPDYRAPNRYARHARHHLRQTANRRNGERLLQGQKGLRFRRWVGSFRFRRLGGRKSLGFGGFRDCLSRFRDGRQSLGGLRDSGRHCPDRFGGNSIYFDITLGKIPCQGGTTNLAKSIRNLSNSPQTGRDFCRILPVSGEEILRSVTKMLHIAIFLSINCNFYRKSKQIFRRKSGKSIHGK